MEHRKTYVETNPSPVKRVYEWTDPQTGITLTPGMPVAVDAYITKRKNSLKFQFRCFAENKLTGTHWVEVFGGGPKLAEAIRAFKPSEVSAIKPKRSYKRRPR